MGLAKLKRGAEDIQQAFLLAYGQGRFGALAMTTNAPGQPKDRKLHYEGPHPGTGVRRVRTATAFSGLGHCRDETMRQRA